MMDYIGLASLITSCFAIISFFFTYFKEIAEIKERLTSLEVKVTPFWNFVNSSLPSLLKSHNTPCLDYYLERYVEKKGNLNKEELEEMIRLLDEKTKVVSKELGIFYGLLKEAINVKKNMK